MHPRYRNSLYNQRDRASKGVKDYGKHRRAGKTTHSDPSNGAGSSARASSSWTFTFPEHSRREIPYAGVRAGEIIGYRAWFDRGYCRLGSLAHDFIWEPGQTIEGKVDEVINITSAGPLFGGSYAFSSMNSLMEEFYSTMKLWENRIGFPSPLYLSSTLLSPFPVFYTEPVAYGIVFGTIKMWGEVVEHEFGYRAQYAKIASLYKYFGVNELADFCRRYNV